MAVQVRVSCITRTSSTSAHARIERIGGVDSNGRRWQLAESQAIDEIKSGEWTFYVEPRAGHRVKVVIARRLGREYLKTEADGEQPDNLLALPDCLN
jgi:hypothetical protein